MLSFQFEDYLSNFITKHFSFDKNVRRDIYEICDFVNNHCFVGWFSITSRMTLTKPCCTTWTPPSPVSSPSSAPWRFTPSDAGWVWRPEYVRDDTTWQQRHKQPHLVKKFFRIISESSNRTEDVCAINADHFIFQLMTYFPSVPWSHWRPGQHDGGLQCGLHCLLYPGESPQDRGLRLEGR